MLKEITFKTNEKYEIIDLTAQIEEIIRDSKIKNGLCLLQAPHATAALILNENEEGLKEDILRKIKELAKEDENYKHSHIETNAPAHIISSILGTSKVIPIENSQPVLGTWQNILFVELDGPRYERKVVVKILKES